MKFGKTYETHLTTEWRQQYMNYRGLDMMIRRAVENAPDAKVPRSSDYTREDDIASSIEIITYYMNFERHFFDTCHQELSRVEDFFAQKFAEARRKLYELQVRFGVLHGSAQYEEHIHNPRQLGLACSEFYLSLIMLQNFQSLNYTAFQKICKKYDKHIKSRRGALWFRNYVINAPFAQEAGLRETIVEVERLYTTYLTNGDRPKAMAKLRVPPLRQPSSAGQVFLAGVLLGLFVVSSIIVLISVCYLRNQTELIATFGRLYRGTFSWVLCSFYLATNIYVWQNVGINHVLIFEVDVRKNVPPAVFLAVASFLGYLCTMSMLMFLHHNEFGVNEPYHFPLVPLVVPFVLLINPLCICYRSGRMWIIRRIGNVLVSPFNYVNFAEFWMADQLNSVTICLVDNYHLIRFYFRYYMNSVNFLDFEGDFIVPLIQCLPPWFRIAQCMRRYWSSLDKPISYPLNALKYGTSIAVVLCSSIVMETKGNYGSVFENPWIWSYLVMSLISTVYSTTWDLIWDFGLLQIWKGENIFLREHLIYPKWFYYFAIVANILMRCFWIVELFLIANDILLPYDCSTIASFCEITRRFIWNFLRLENEHLFNCGMFRATRDIFLTPIALESKSSLSILVNAISRGVQANLPKKHIPKKEN